MNRGLAVVLLAAALGAPGPLAADELGRLFFTPEQRALLDLARRTQTAGPSEAPTEGLTLSGIVTRSDGRNTVWINGRPHPGAGVNPRSPATAVIPVPGMGQAVRLRVGQTLDPINGRVQEGWRRLPPPAETKSARGADRRAEGKAAPPAAGRETDEEGDAAPPEAPIRP